MTDDEKILKYIHYLEQGYSLVYSRSLAGIGEKYDKYLVETRSDYVKIKILFRKFKHDKNPNFQKYVVKNLKDKLNRLESKCLKNKPD
jgi:hypothetical protein